MSDRKLVIELRLTGPNITLDDLRWLVQQATSYDGDSKVDVKGRRDVDQRDFDPEQIIIHGLPTGKLKPVLTHRSL